MDPRSLRSATALCAILCATALAAPAMAGTRAGVDVALSGKVSTNPFNGSNPGSAVVAISPSISPFLTYQDPDTVAELRGSVMMDQYTRVYGRNTNGDVQANIQQQVSHAFALRAGADYFNSNVGLHDLLLARTTAADAVIPIGTPLPDVSIAGLRTHMTTISGNLGADIKLSQRASMNVNFSGALSRSDASTISDFVNESAYVGLSRRISPRTSATASIQFSNIDYFKTDRGDGTIISPQLGITRQISQRISLGLNIGATIANSNALNGTKNNFTVLSGSLRLCDEIDHGAICLNAARTAQPTALGGIAASTDIALNVDRRFGRDNTISLTARYSRVEQANERLGFKQDFVGMMVTYNRQISNRVSAFITPSYSKSFDNVAPRDGNFEVRAGIRARFGALQ